MSCKKIEPQIVNRKQLAQIAGRSLPTVSDWIRRGMPTLGRDPSTREWRIDTAAAIAWLVERSLQPSAGPLDLDQERARESKERADKYALDNARMRRDLIASDEVQRLWEAMRGRVRRRLRSVPAEAAARAPGFHTAAVPGFLVMIDEALAELSPNGLPPTGEEAFPCVLT